MTIKEVKSVVQQSAIPQTIQQEIISIATTHIRQERDVDIIVDTTAIVMEVYEESTRIETVKRTFAKASIIEFLMADDAEIPED